MVGIIKQIKLNRLHPAKLHLLKMISKIDRIVKTNDSYDYFIGDNRPIIIISSDEYFCVDFNNIWTPCISNYSGTFRENRRSCEKLLLETLNEWSGYNYDLIYYNI